MKGKLVTWTARRRPAEAQPRLFLMMLEGTGDAAFAVDSSGRISGWNKAAVELFGHSQADALSLRCHQLLQCSDEDGFICSEECIIERWATNDRPLVSFDLRLQTRAGQLWCNLSTLVASDPLSGGSHAIYIVRPIEVSKRLEQALSEFVRTRVSANGRTTMTSLPAPCKKIRLTKREIEVLKSLANGHNTQEIANQLNISSATVRNHVKHILTKFGAHTRLEAIRHAEATGII